MNVPIYDYVAGRFIFFTKSFSSLATEPINNLQPVKLILIIISIDLKGKSN